MDLDNDGVRDLLSGSYSRMESPMAGLFQVLWGQADGSFKKAAVLTGMGGEPLIIPAEGDDQITENICTRPFAVDWDSDGDLDLIVGNFAGGFYLFTGEGNGRFQAKPESVLALGSPLKIDGEHSDPFPVDWDRDGDLDLVSGTSNGGVYWSENLAGVGKAPKLQPFAMLIPPPSNRENHQTLSERDLTGPVMATRVWVDDLDSDGKLDVLVGDSVTLTSPAEGVSEKEFEKKRSEWQRSYRAIRKEIDSSVSGEAKHNEALKRYAALYRKRQEIMVDEMTGLVWLYLQK